MGFIGALVVTICVWGGYIIAGGKMGPIFKAAPIEMLIIFGAALGAYIIANPTKTVKMGFSMGLKAFSKGGPSKKDYVELLQLLFQLFQIYRKEGPQGLEKHIEKPEESTVMKAYPNFLKNHHASDYLCDTLKIVLSADLSPYDIEDLLTADIKAAHVEEHKAQSAIQAVADGLPGLGIVAAVLGIVKTMGHLNDGPEVIGSMVGAALVGTMLGVYGAYGYVAPLATKVSNDIELEGRYLEVIKASLIALQKGVPPLVCVEFGRRTIFPHERPTFEELDTATKEVKKAA